MDLGALSDRGFMQVTPAPGMAYASRRCCTFKLCDPVPASSVITTPRRAAWASAPRSYEFLKCMGGRCVVSLSPVHSEAGGGFHFIHMGGAMATNVRTPYTPDCIATGDVDRRVSRPARAGVVLPRHHARHSVSSAVCGPPAFALLTEPPLFGRLYGCTCGQFAYYLRRYSRTDGALLRGLVSGVRSGRPS